MKAIVIYYSLTEGTERVANSIHKVINADLYPLQLQVKPCVKGYLRLFVIAKQVFFKEKPLLVNGQVNLDAYDVVFIGTPIWMGTLAPAMRSFLAQARLNEKIVIPFCTYEASSERYFDDLHKISPMVKFILGMGFQFPKEVEEAELEERVRVWLNNVKA